MAEIVFILYKPAVPGNIGSCARAMKTMGFSELRLISPGDHLSDEARMMAHGSYEILENSEVFESFDEAVADLDLIISTTAKQKAGKVDYLDSGELSTFIKDKGDLIQKVGIVFGSEESGLPNEVLLKSNIGVSIPMAASYPSLNLSHALMIVAYELGKAASSQEVKAQINQDEASWKELQERTETILKASGIKSTTPLYHRIIERMSFMKAKDARLAHSISSRILDLLRN